MDIIWNEDDSIFGNGGWRLALSAEQTFKTGPDGLGCYVFIVSEKESEWKC